MEQTRHSRAGSGRSLVLAILLIIFGFLAIAVPFAASKGVVLVIAWLVVFSGAVQFVHAFQSKGVGRMLWKLLVAALYVGIGFYFVLHPLLGVAALTLALAIFFVMEGTLDLVFYIQSRHLAGSGWILFDSIITLILGVIIWRHWLASSLWVTGTLIGISMMMTGITRLMVGLAVRRAQRFQMGAAAGSH